MKHWRRAYFGLLYALPVVLFFSYYPLISFGRNATMNFELSLPLIWLVIFAIVAFVTMILLGLAARWEQRPALKKTKLGINFPGISDRRFFLFALFPLFVTLSIFWSPNTTRAILTTGILWLVFFAIFAIVFLTPLLSPDRNFRRNLLRVFFLGSAAVCLFCWLQCILDLAGVDREHSLLCMGCTYRTFGFPHPSGFAIEPQFMGNLLLAPTFTALYLLVFRSAGLRQRAAKAKKSLNLISVRESRWLLGFALLFSATLFVTMSRGAIYAYGIGVLILLGFALYRRYHQPQPAKSSPVHWQQLLIIPISTFFITLLAQGIFSAVSPTSDTFRSGTAKVVHQLSLGIIDFRPQPPAAPSESPDSPTQTPNNSGVSSTDSAPDSAFDGYVAASTNVRLELSKFGLWTWLSSAYHPASGLYVGLNCNQPYSSVCLMSAPLTPTSMLFGVGIGGAGMAMDATFPDEPLVTPDNIVQNEFVSLLLETGIIGIMLLLLILLLAFGPRSEFWRHPALPLLAALIIAYIVTLNFFSGFANALQIYLLPPLLFLCFKSQKTLAKT